MKKSSIICTNLTKQYHAGHQRFTGLHNFSYEFLQGNRYALIGPSGSGKSTLIHLIVGIEMPTSGTIAHSYEQKQYGLMLQTPFLINELSVLENIALPGLIEGVPMADAIKRAEELITLVGLRAHAHVSPWQLSGGQQQRIALARALFFSPPFLIADEPTAHLDPDSARGIASLLISLSEEHGMGLIVATHDRDMIAFLENVVSIG